jgi:hypothetical protein
MGITKIVSNEDKEKKVQRNQLIIGVVLILIMLFSTIGFAFSFGITGNAVQEIEYNGVEFFQDPNTGFWGFNVDGRDYFTIYNPEDVQNISFVNFKQIGDYADKPVYFIGDAGDGFAELYRALSGDVQRVGGACLDENCEEDYPIKNCSVDNIIIVEEVVEDRLGDGNESVNDIVIDKYVDIEEGISTNVNCVYIKAKPENLVRYIDAYIFDLLGVR